MHVTGLQMLALLFTITATLCFAQTSTKPFKSALEDVVRGPEYQSSQNDIRAIELDYASRELVLQPILELEGRRLNENRQLFNPNAVNPGRQTKPRIDSFGLTLIKPFSTGTEIEIGPRYEKALMPAATPNYRDTVDWQISLSQSLWKDAFGRSTRLRRAREDYERREELAEALLAQGQLLYDFESLYWDWALALRENELQAKNVRRSREILKWVQDRFNRAAAESTDLLQARALLTQRELQVSALQFSLTQVGTRIERYVPNRNWQPDPNDLSITRNPDELTSVWQADELSQTQQLQYLQAHNEALAAEERARESRESIRPDLNLQLAYGKNAIDTDSSAALRRSYEDDYEYSSIGLVFRTGLDLGNERRMVDSARAESRAATLKREARAAENQVAWEQLKKELKDLEDRIERARQLVDLQTRKANAERERYRKGRSTAFQAITFEQEAVEAEITLWQLYALMRKTEARARLFAR